MDATMDGRIYVHIHNVLYINAVWLDIELKYVSNLNPSNLTYKLSQAYFFDFSNIKPCLNKATIII